MPTLNIPEEDFPAYIAIAGFDNDSFESLLKACVETPPSLRRSKYLSHLSAKVPASVRKEASTIINVLFSLYFLKDSQKLSPDDIAKVISRSALTVEDLAAHLDGDKAEILKKRLTALLSFDDSVGVMVKAVNLSTEFDKYLCDSRILSDIRIVFSKTPDVIRGAIVVHNLQLGFHDGTSGDHHEIYIALDDNDLVELKETIERAQKKGTAMKQLLNNSKVAVVEA